MERNYTHVSYPSVASLFAMIEQPCKDAKNAALTEDHAKTREKDQSWYGAGLTTAAQTLAAIREGYPQGEAQVRAFHDKISATLPRAIGHHRAIVRGDMGDHLDIHMVNSGRVDRAWTSSKRRLKKGSGILRLCIDLGANANTNAEDMQWRGVAGITLAEIMGKAGYSVEIVGCFAVCETPVDMTISITLKPRTSQADFGLLAATACLPGFFRTLGFAAIIRENDNQRRRADKILGHYVDVSGLLPVPERVTQLFVPGTIHNEATATEWINQTIKLLHGV